MSDTGKSEWPCSQGAEEAVLGDVLRNPALLDEIGEGVELFHFPANRSLFRLLVAFRPKNDAAFDLDWLAQRVIDNELDDAVGGAMQLRALAAKAAPRRAAADLAELRDRHARRVAIASADWAMSAARDLMEDDFSSAFTSGASLIEAALAGVNDFPANIDLAKDWLATFQDRIAGKVSSMGLPTIPEIDGLLRGMHPGRIWVIGAYPGGGKSVIGSQILTDSVLAEDPVPGVFITLEMGEAALFDRMMIQASGVSAKVVSEPRYADNRGPNKHEVVALDRAARALSAAPFRLYRPPSRKLGVVASALRRASREMGARIAVVDYLQLIRAPIGKGQNREEEVTQISHALADVAGETGMQILLLSQLNADGETKHGRVIEEDADAFLTIDQDRKRDSENFKQWLGMTLVKDRYNGNSGRKIPLVLNQDKLRFVHGLPPQKEPEPKPRGGRARRDTEN